MTARPTILVTLAVAGTCFPVTIRTASAVPAAEHVGRGTVDDRQAEPSGPRGIFPELLQFEKRMKGLARGADGLVAAQERICLEFVEACERRYGPQSSEVAEANFALGGQADANNEARRAEELMRRGIAVREQVYGETAVELTCDLFLYAEFLAKNVRFPEAIRCVDRALAIHARASGEDHPDTILALQVLADLHAAIGQADTAAERAERARLARKAALPRKNPAAPDWAQLFRPHQHCAANLFLNGQTEEAAFHFERAVLLRPDLGENHNNIGTIHRVLADAAGRTGDKDGAARMYRLAIDRFAEACRLEPNVTAMRVNLATSLMAAERFEDAAAALREVVARDPNDARMILTLGYALHRSGRKAEAITEFRKALRLDPSLEEARDWLESALAERDEP